MPLTCQGRAPLHSRSANGARAAPPQIERFRHGGSTMRPISKKEQSLPANVIGHHSAHSMGVIRAALLSLAGCSMRWFNLRGTNKSPRRAKSIGLAEANRKADHAAHVLVGARRL